MKRAIVMVVALALLLSGCATQAAPTESVTMDKGAGNYNSAPELAVPQEGDNYSTGAGEAAPQRLVIQNANMSIVVARPLEALNAITALASEFNGFVVSSYSRTVTINETKEVVEASISLRVDSARLNTAMERIRALTANAEKDVISENIAGQDVTREYVDLESRLRNLKQTEIQLQKIMDEATTTEDVLAVYRELTSIREQIEVTTGQMKYFEEASTLSSISVFIQAQEAIQPIQVGGWRPVGTARNAVQALLNTLKVVVRVAIWLFVYIIPTALVIGLPIWLIVRGIRSLRRRVKARRASQAPVETGR